MKHPYAEILHAIADGKRVQFQCSHGQWFFIPSGNALTEIGSRSHSADCYRIHQDDVEPTTEESSVVQLISQLEAERTARQEAQRQLADLQELQAKSGLAHRKDVQAAVAEAMKTASDIAEILQSKLGGTRNFSGLDDDEIELWDKCQSLIDSARCKS